MTPGRESGVTTLALSLRLTAARRGHVPGTALVAAAAGLQALEEWELLPQRLTHATAQGTSATDADGPRILDAADEVKRSASFVPS